MRGAALRCDLLVDRVASTDMPSVELLPLLLERLRATTETGATATLLAAILPRLADLPPANHGHPSVARKTAATDFDAAYGPFLDKLGRCGTGAVCPACRLDEPCPLDVWRHALAPLLMTNLKAETSYLQISGRTIGKGAYTTMARRHRALADAGLRMVYRRKLEVRQRDVAQAIAALACQVGCRDPEIAEAQAIAVSAPVRAADLAAGIAVCADVLAEANGSTDDAWRSLPIRHADLSGRLARLSAENRHHPTHPVRSRPLRFHPVSAGEAPPETIAPAPLRWQKLRASLAAKTERLAAQAAATGPQPPDLTDPGTI